MDAHKLEIKKQYRIYLVGQLARYFHLNKEDLLKDNDLGVDEIMGFNTIPDFRHIVFVTHASTLNISTLCVGSKFLKSFLYAEFLDAENKIQEDVQPDLVMAIHVKAPGSASGEFWVMRRRDRDETSTYGGLIVSVQETAEYFILEPINNFLMEFYPISQDMD